MMTSRPSAEVATASANWRCSSSSSVSSSRAVSPITPFIGVRISWLMLARNSDFIRDPATASSRAVARWSVRARFSKMTVRFLITPRLKTTMAIATPAGSGRLRAIRSNTKVATTAVADTLGKTSRKRPRPALFKDPPTPRAGGGWFASATSATTRKPAIHSVSLGCTPT